MYSGNRITVTEEFQRARDGRWLGGDLHGIDMARNGTVVLAGMVAGTHYPDGYLKDGVPVAQTADGKFALFNADAGDGITDQLYGFTLDPQDVLAGDTEVVTAVYFHGGIVLAQTIDGDDGPVVAGDLPALLWEA